MSKVCQKRERESALTHRLTDSCPSCSWDGKRLKISTLITFRVKFKLKDTEINDDFNFFL